MTIEEERQALVSAVWEGVIAEPPEPTLATLPARLKASLKEKHE